MTFIDTNLTYSQQVCDMAIGSIAGGLAVLLFIGRIFIGLAMFYLIYRVTEIFIRKYKHIQREKEA